MIGQTSLTWVLTRQLRRWRAIAARTTTPPPRPRWVAWWSSRRLRRAFPGPHSPRPAPGGRAGARAVERALPVIVDRVTPDRQRLPRLWRVSVHPSPFGWEITFNRPRTTETVNLRPDVWCKVLDVHEVRFVPAGKRVTVDVRMRNPFATPLPANANPLQPGARPRWQAGYLIGRHLDGTPLRYLPDRDHNFLLAGTMGSGKTTLADLLIGQMLLDPGMDVVVVDPQGGSQLGHWAPWCWGFGTEERSALDALWAVYLRGEQNLEQMAATPGIVKSWQGRRVTLIVDEANTASKWGPKRDGIPEAQWLMTRIMERHRSAGTQVGIVSQRPQHESLGTTIRAHCQTRYVFTMSSNVDGAMALTDETKADVPYDASMLAPKSGQLIVRTVAADRAAGRAITLAQTWHCPTSLLNAIILTLPLTSERETRLPPPSGTPSTPPPSPLNENAVIRLARQAITPPEPDNGPTLKARRQALGITQPQLAEAAGLTDKTVRAAEQDRASTATRQRLATTLDTIDAQRFT